MKLYDEIYFEITVSGNKGDIKKFAKYLTSGAFDDLFDITDDFLSYDDEFSTKEDGDATEMVFANDDFGIELSSLDTDDFLEIFCKDSALVEIRGQIYDINDEEYSFVSPRGSVDYKNARGDVRFNDELDALAEEDECEEDEEY